MHILIAGVGILGRTLLRELLQRGHSVTAIALRESEFEGVTHPRFQGRVADVTHPASLHGCAEKAEVVVSCIGITRMRGALTHMAVDFQGNLNLLHEAERAGASRFVVISPEGIELGKSAAPLLEARQRFEHALQKVTTDSLIVHSGGFFADLAEMARMARRAPLMIIGGGRRRFTPIAVSDLAALVADDIEHGTTGKRHVGGPETLSWNQIAATFATHWGIRPRTIHVPVSVCRALLAVLKPFTPTHYAMGRLLVFMYTHDLPTPEIGTTFLSDYLRENLPPVPAPAMEGATAAFATPRGS